MLSKVELMKKELFIGTVTFVLQNLTKNASNAAGNASAGVNQTGSELRKNASEVGKNASELGGQILNKTEDVGKKIASGLGSLLGNASEKLKEGSK